MTNTVVKVNTVHLRTVPVRCCIRHNILVTNTVVKVNTVHLRTVPVRCYIIHNILVTNTVVKVNTVHLRTVPVRCYIRHNILVTNNVAKLKSLSLRTVAVCCYVRHNILKLLDTNIVMYVCTYDTLIIMDVHLSLFQVFIPCNLLYSFVFQDIPGIVAFLTAKDIPGKNSFVPVGIMFMYEDEEVSFLCSYKRRW